MPGMDFSQRIRRLASVFALFAGGATPCLAQDVPTCAFNGGTRWSVQATIAGSKMSCAVTCTFTRKDGTSDSAGCSFQVVPGNSGPYCIGQLFGADISGVTTAFTCTLIQ
jgi:hypothetical protein